MKKFALYIGLAILLLFLIIIIIPAEENTGLGSNPGNILNGGCVAEDEEYIYYSVLKGNSAIYKAKKDFSEETKLATNILGAEYLNIAGKYIYYTEGRPGFIWKMRKNGIFRWPVLLKSVTNVIISGDRIYYRLNLSDGIWVKTEWLKPYVGSLYSCDLNGRDKKLISKEEIRHFVVDGEKIYYTDHTDNYSLWRMDVSGENKEKIHPNTSSVPKFDEKYLYFTSENFFYRMDKETLEKKVLLEGSFSESNVCGDWIYYIPYQTGEICRMKKDGTAKELLFESNISEFYVAENAILFEVPDDGFYRFDIETRELTKLSDD